VSTSPAGDGRWRCVRLVVRGDGESNGGVGGFFVEGDGHAGGGDGGVFFDDLLGEGGGGAGGDGDGGGFGGVGDSEVSGVGDGVGAEGDEGGGEGLGGGEGGVVGDGERAFVLAGVNPGAGEFGEGGDVVGAGEVEGEGVGGVGESGLEDFGLGDGAGALELVGDDRDCVAEGVEKVGIVAVGGEGAGGVVFGAGVEDEALFVEDEDVGAEVVVVVGFVVVAAFEGDADVAVGMESGAGDEDAGGVEEIAELVGGVGGGRGLGGGVVEVVDGLFGEIGGYGGGREVVERGEAEGEAAIEIEHDFGIGLRVDGAVGEGGGDGVDDLDAGGKSGGSLGFGAGQEVEFSGGGLTEEFGEHDVVAEAVVPVAEAFGAVAVGGEAFEEVSGVEFGGGDEEGAGVAVGDFFEGGAGDAGEADGVPVHFGGLPPPGGLLAGIAFEGGSDDAAIEVVGDQGAGVGVEFVAEHVEGGGEVPAECGGGEFDVDGGAVEVGELRIVGGEDPGGFGAEGVDVVGDLGEVAAIVAEAFGEDEGLEVAAASAGGGVELGAVAVLGEHEEEGVGLGGDGFGEEFVGFFEEGLVAGKGGEVLPGGAVGDGGADAGGGEGEELFDSGDARGVGEGDGGGGEGGKAYKSNGGGEKKNKDFWMVFHSIVPCSLDLQCLNLYVRLRDCRERSEI
jgi:hypothetical protein